MRWAFSKTLQKTEAYLSILNSYLSQSHISFDICMIFDITWLISSSTWPDLWTNLIPALIFDWKLISAFTWLDLLFDLTQFPFLIDLGSVLTSALISKIFDLKLIFLNWSWFWQDLARSSRSATFWVDLSLTWLIPSLTTPLIGNCSSLTLTHVTQSQMKLAKKVQFESRSHSPPRVMESSWFNISLTSFSHKLWHSIKVQWSEWSVSHQSSWPSWGLLKIGQGYLILLNTVSYGLIFY